METAHQTAQQTVRPAAQTVKQTSASVTKAVARTAEQVTGTTTQIVQTVQQTIANPPVAVPTVPAVPTVSAPAPLPIASAPAPTVASEPVVGEQAPVEQPEPSAAQADAQPEPQAPAPPAAQVLAPDREVIAARPGVVPVATLETLVREADQLTPPATDTVDDVENDSAQADLAVALDTIIIDVHDRQPVNVSAPTPAADDPLQALSIHDVPPPDLAGAPMEPVHDVQPRRTGEDPMPRPLPRAGVPASLTSSALSGVSSLTPGSQLATFEDLWARLTQTGRRIASVIVLPNLAPPG